MIKTLRLSFLGALLLCTATASNAQFFIGVGGIAHQYKDLGLFPGVQARAGIEINSGRFTSDIGFNYSPAAQEQSFSVLYTNASTLEFADVQYTQRIKVMNLFIHGHINLGNDEQAFQPGAFFGMSFDEYSVKYDKGNAPAGFTDPTPGAFTDTSFGGGVKVDLGLKGNYRIGPGAIYAEALVGLPIFRNLGAGSGAPVPAVAHYGLQVGYKFYIGPWRFEYRNSY